MEVLNDSGVEFHNLKRNYLTALRSLSAGLGVSADFNKDDVITVKSSYSSSYSSGYCNSSIYCRSRNKVLGVIITTNNRFRYSYKNEVKNACRP